MRAAHAARQCLPVIQLREAARRRLTAAQPQLLGRAQPVIVGWL